jgi:DNA-binding PucR family transcriptional regulator
MDSLAPNTIESPSPQAPKSKSKIFWRFFWILILIRLGWKVSVGEFDYVMPWKYQAMSNLVKENTKTKLVSTSAKLNKLIATVEADEAKIKDASITQKTDSNVVLQKRQEISLLYKELQDTIVQDGQLVKKMMKNGAFIEQYIDIYSGLTTSAEKAKTINSKLTSFDPNQSIYLGSRK